MKWVTIQLSESFVTRETEKAARIRLPRWLDDVTGSFWVPAGCIKRDGIGVTLCMPADLKIEICYKKADVFGVFGDWQKRTYSPETVKTRMFEVDGHEPIRGDAEFTLTAQELAPVVVEPLPELVGWQATRPAPWIRRNNDNTKRVRAFYAEMRGAGIDIDTPTGYAEFQPAPPRFELPVADFGKKEHRKRAGVSKSLAREL